jgi:ABC-2 type transport system ATP-binding protein
VRMTPLPDSDIIRLSALRRWYGPLLALDCPDVRLPPGVIGLLGPNGAGKSTLLKVLLGLLPPSSGRAELLGLEVPRDALAIRARVGYLPETAAITPGLKALEMVALAGRLAGMPRRDSLRRAHEVLDYLGVEESRYRPVEDQSTGTRQRIGLAAALVHDPPLLVLDEPTNGLDPAGRRAMLDLIASLHRDFGKSVLLSSHLLEDVDRLSDSLLILKEGRAVAHGLAADLRLDLHARYLLRLTGEAGPALSALTAEGVTVVGEPKTTAGAWEGIVQAPEGWSPKRLFAILETPPGNAAVLRALVPQKERMAAIFERLAGEAAAGTGARGSGAGGDGRAG